MRRGANALSALVRWLSLRAYGLVTSALFGATTPPLRMRARFERFGRTSRESIRRRFPNVVFEDQSVDRLAIESVRAVAAPARVILYLHGGGFSSLLYRQSLGEGLRGLGHGA